MSWFDDDGYKRDDFGNFWDHDEAERATNNGDLRHLANGPGYWDPATGNEYWDDGTKK